MQQEIEKYHTIARYYDLVGGDDIKSSPSSVATPAPESKNTYVHTKMSKPMSMLLQTLKLSAEEVPFAGEAVAVINVVVSTASFFSVLKKTIDSSQHMKSLISKMTFANGPDDCQKLVDSFTNEDLQVLCQFIPKLSANLRNCISDWISTIPELGPVLAVVVNNESDYDKVKAMYDSLPESTKKLFQNPDQLIIMCDQMIEAIRSDLLGIQAQPETPPPSQPQTQSSSPPPPQPPSQPQPPQTGAGFFSTISSGISSVTTFVGDQTRKTFQRVTAPTMYALHLMGIDKVIVNTTLHYIDRVLAPSVAKSAETLKIVFPLFFVFLIVENKCNSSISN